MFKKKAQMGGLITGIIFGVASLVIGVIISFVIVSTLLDADLLSTDRDVVLVSNESGAINNTGYALTGGSAARFIPGTISISRAYNGSNVISSGNWTISSTGNISNASEVTYALVNFTYTYTLYNQEETSSTDLKKNFTSGVDNVSEKIPTVLLVAAIVLILGILVLLVAAWQRMRMSGGGI